ncbi:MAG: transposase [Bacilli bacterium]|nr:transposase [Bacilli bacterium]
MSVLHTYGRDLKFNPHIHMILLDGGISENNFVKNSLEEKINWKKKCLNWRDMIIWHFSKDPQQCPNCKIIMVYYNTEFT